MMELFMMILQAWKVSIGVVNSFIFDMAGSLALPVIKVLLLLVFRELSLPWSMWCGFSLRLNILEKFYFHVTLVSVFKSVGQSVSRSVGQLVSWSVGQSVSRSVRQSVRLSVRQMVSWSDGHSFSQTANQSVSEWASEWVSEWLFFGTG